MNRLLVLTDNPRKADFIRAELGAAFELECIGPDEMKDRVPGEALLADIQLEDDDLFLQLRDWLKSRTRQRKAVFLVDPSSATDSIRSAELGATDILRRPLDRSVVFTALLGDFDALLLDPSQPPIRSYPAMAPALDALEGIFASSRFGSQLELPAIQEANDAVLEQVRGDGLESWLDVVRRHHSQTYQHSLVVVGVTAAFSGRLGLSGADQAKMTLGAMFHDLGKVHIPIAVLEKPAALSAEEMLIMRNHPQYGFESLRDAKGIDPDILEIVHHHHEFLDGSGYPNMLPAHKIRDRVRILTICDIFGALIEKRSYKPAMSSEAAFAEMRAMGGKLDADILREFSFASELRLAA